MAGEPARWPKEGEDVYYITYFIMFFVGIASSTASDPIPPPELQVGWQRVQIPDVGTIDIPPTMEVQGGTLAKISGEYKKQLIPESDSSEIGQVIVIQQRGLNALDAQAVKLYVRVIVQTTMTNPGDFETLNSRYDITDGELREFSIGVRTQVENQFMRILQWDVPSVELINGMQAIRLSYRRQMKDSPAVRVATYIFQNYDRIHELTMSYRESERNVWLIDFPAILNSFRITNVRETAISTHDRRQFDFADDWILNLIVSAILTWGIGLAPPLLTRFAILRRPITKVSGIVFVSIFWFLNLITFIAMGSQSKTHGALFFVAVASYYILRSGWKKYEVKVPSQPEHVWGVSQKQLKQDQKNENAQSIPKNGSKKNGQEQSQHTIEP